MLISLIIILCISIIINISLFNKLTIINKEKIAWFDKDLEPLVFSYRENAKPTRADIFNEGSLPDAAKSLIKAFQTGQLKASDFNCVTCGKDDCNCEDLTGKCKPTVSQL